MIIITKKENKIDIKADGIVEMVNILNGQIIKCNVHIEWQKEHKMICFFSFLVVKIFYLYWLKKRDSVGVCSIILYLDKENLIKI